MQDIEQEVINNYQENIEYFEKNFPHVHNKLLALETLLDDGRYAQKYDLEYKDGYFDIVELSSGAYLYNENSINFSKQLLNEVNYKKNQQVFKTQRKLVFEKEVIEFVKTNYEKVYEKYATTAEIIQYYQDNTDEDDEMLLIDKYIFLGVGLGFHVKNIVEKFDLQVSLIIEDDIELFRLSLFTTNYKEVFKNRTLFISLNEDKNQFNNTFSRFYVNALIKNLYIKYTMFSSRYEDKIALIQSELISRPEATYSQERLLLKNHRVVDRIKKDYKFLDTRKKEKEDFFKDKPFLVVGSGPSLHKNIKWLEKNQNKFVIISALTSLKTLQKSNIYPDIVVQIDEHDRQTKKSLDNLKDLDFIRNSIFMLSASAPQIMLDSFDKSQIYLHEDRTKYKLGKSGILTTSVGDTMYTLSLVFNAKDIYLLGLDLAFGEDGSTHSPDHIKADKLQNEIENAKSEDFQLETSFIKVKGNFKDEVLTNPLFAMSIPVINTKTKELKTKEQNVYNLNDGAYFIDTIPKRVDDIDIKDIDKKNLKNELLFIFDKYSTDKLSQEEIKALGERDKFIKDIFSNVELFKIAPTSTKEIFTKNYLALLNSILGSKYIYELKDILTIFFLVVAPYISDLFNTKDLKNRKKHIKKIKAILIKQIEKIVKAYKNDLDSLR